MSRDTEREKPGLPDIDGLLVLLLGHLRLPLAAGGKTMHANLHTQLFLNTNFLYQVFIITTFT